MTLKGIKNYQLIEGDITETLPDFLKSQPYQRIAYLHIDVDIYKPTKIIFDLLFDRVVRNGVIVLDDYNDVAGETNAVDEFIADKDLIIEKSPIAHSPAFIRKK